MAWNPEAQELVPLDGPHARPGIEVTARERNWTRFQVGELVTFKGVSFTVTEIGPRRMVLRPVIKEKD